MTVFTPYNRTAKGTRRQIARPTFDRLDNYGWQRQYRPGDDYPTFTLAGATLTTDMSDQTGKTYLATLPTGQVVTVSGSFADITAEVIVLAAESEREMFVHVIYNDPDEIPFDGRPVVYDSQADDYGLQPEF